MKQRITCTNAGHYHLTRGKQYELLAHDKEEEQVIVCADNGRSRWFPACHFDLSGSLIPLLTAWRFDDPVIDEINDRDETNNWVDVTLKFDDGTWRWCQMVTPDFLKGLLAPGQSEPMFYAKNAIIVRDLTVDTVEEVLLEMEENGDINEYSLPLEPSE
jgi:hypothetical protein